MQTRGKGELSEEEKIVKFKKQFKIKRGGGVKYLLISMNGRCISGRRYPFLNNNIGG